MSHIETIAEQAAHERIIRPSRGLVPIDFAELWRYRELIWTFAWRNLLVRYKQTYLGAFWVLVQPVLIMVVLTIVFGKVAEMPANGAPYPILTFAAVLPWQFFGSALTSASGSLVNSQSLITKIYFPRLALPISATLSGAVDFLISLVILIALMIWYGTPLTVNMLALPFFFLLVFVAALAFSLWFGALSVNYRDVAHVVPFVVRFGLYASPVGFLSSSLVPRFLSGDQLIWYYVANPLSGILEGFRWCVLGHDFAPLWDGLWMGGVVIGIVFVGGVYYFRSVESRFADVI